MNQKTLDLFGRILIQRIRDEAIEEWYDILNGKKKGVTAKKIQKLLTSFDEEQLDVLRQIIPEIVDTTLHYLLWTLEQENSINVFVEINGEMNSNIRDVSDGLAGELYSEDGWIAKYSKYKYPL